ncbi:MAG: exosortase H [gamma proteobacterium symbiont of Taylorina sp.]|nr:exosortase H [gamma proteobacterium symbiont of Taylorina sp.]
MKSSNYYFPKFISLLLILFLAELLSITQQNIIIPWTQFLAELSAFLVQLFDTNTIAQGVVLRDIQSGFAVSIQPGCNGIEAIIVLIAAIVAYPASIKAKINGIAFGFLAIQFLNVIRIISLFYLGQWNQMVFEWAHQYVWQALIMLDVLLVFIIWIRMTGRKMVSEHV